MPFHRGHCALRSAFVRMLACTHAQRVQQFARGARERLVRARTSRVTPPPAAHISSVQCLWPLLCYSAVRRCLPVLRISLCVADVLCSSVAAKHQLNNTRTPTKPTTQYSIGRRTDRQPSSTTREDVRRNRRRDRDKHLMNACALMRIVFSGTHTDVPKG